MTARLSVQLYSLREQASADFPGVIARLGRIGYVGVEPAGLHDLSPTAFCRCVADAGLVVSSSHIPLVPAEAAGALLDTQQEIGADTVVVAFIPPERFADADGLARSAAALNALNERVRERGMTLGYHNHWWELRTQIDGLSAFARLFERLDASVIAEVDTYWAQVGGADPVKLVAELGARAPLLHVKDGPADGPDSPMTAVGEGAVPVDAVLRANDSVRWHVVELDRCATDMFEAIERSHAWLTARGLSRGRA
jgi:sugar phosphate isomerase/epimerase